MATSWKGQSPAAFGVGQGLINAAEGFSKNFFRGQEVKDALAQKAAELTATQAHQERLAKLQEKQLKTQAIGEVTRAIKENTWTPYHDKLVEEHGLSANELAPVGPSLEQDMGWDQQQTVAYAPDKTAGVQIPEPPAGALSSGPRTSPKTTIGTFSQPAKISSAPATKAGNEYLGSLPTGRSPELDALAREGAAAKFDMATAAAEREQPRPVFTPDEKQPWDTYDRGAMVAQSPSQDVAFDGYETDELTGRVSPRRVEAPLGKPAPTVTRQSPGAMAAQNRSSVMDAAAKAKRDDEYRKALAVAGEQVRGREIGAEATKAAAKTTAAVGHGRNALTRREQDEENARFDAYAITNKLFRKDANGKVMTDKTGNPLPDRLAAKSMSTLETKREPAGGAPDFKAELQAARDNVIAKQAALTKARERKAKWSPEIGGPLGMADPSIEVDNAMTELADAQQRQAAAIKSHGGRTPTTVRIDEPQTYEEAVSGAKARGLTPPTEAQFNALMGR